MGLTTRSRARDAHEPADSMQRGRVIDGRYAIQGVVGRGAASLVYACRDVQHPGLPVALKLATLSASEGAAARYRDELLIASAIQHPNIARVFSLGLITETGQTYLVMELLNGRNFLQGTEDIEAQEFCEFAAQICRALGFLHRRGCAHGDLKPSNVMVTPLAGAMTVKLLDLGLAWQPDDLERGEAMRTLPYTAPEMLRGQDADSRADLYSLGVLLYEALAGRRPLTQRQTMPAAPPANPRLRVPKGVWNLVLALLDESPGARPASASEVIARLGREAGVHLPFETLDTAQAYVRSGPFCGRRHILAQWESCINSLGSQLDRVQLLAVSGKWGMGKTRLMQELAARGQIHGVKSLLMRCSTRPSPDWAGLYARLEAEAAHRPCALLLDDVHCLGPAALEATLGLVKAAPPENLAVACSFSEEAAQDAGIAPLLPGRARRGGHTPLRLEPFSQEESGCVIGSALPGRPGFGLVSRLQATTHGNPLFLVETLCTIVATQTQALARHEHIVFASELADAGAASLLPSIDERMPNDLSERRLLGMCAVMDRPVSLQLLAYAMPDSLKAIKAQALRLQRAGLVDLDYASTPPLMAITQATIARRASETLAAAEAAQLHQCLAEALSSRLDNAAAFGLHRREATALAAEHLSQAGDVVSASGLAVQAVAQLTEQDQNGQAVRLARIALRSDRLAGLGRQRMLETLGDALARLGQNTDAAGTLSEAAEIAQARADALSRARLRRKQAQAMLSCQRAEEALAILDSTRRETCSLDVCREERVHIQCAIGHALLTNGLVDQAISELRLGLDQAEAITESTPAKAQILCLVGAALVHSGRYDEAREHYEEARALFLEASDALGAAAATEGLAMVSHRLQQFHDAERLYHQAIADVEKRGAPQRLGQLHYNLAAAYQAQCRWSEASRSYEKSIEVRDGTGENASAVWGSLALVSMSEGRLGAALRACDEAVDSAKRSDHPAAYPRALSMLADTWYHVGDLYQAESIARRAEEAIGNRDHPGILSSICRIVGDCCSLRGRRREALDHLERSLHLARRTGSARQQQDVLSDLSDAHFRGGDLQATLDAATQAVGLSQDDEGSISSTRASAQYARALHALGQTREAMELLHGAHAAMDRMRNPLRKAEVAATLAAAYLDEADVARFVCYVSQCLDAFDLAVADLGDMASGRTFILDPRRREVFEMIEKAGCGHGV